MEAPNDTVHLYESCPYPSSAVTDPLIPDLSNAMQYIAPASYYDGRDILDAGCGTGHRVVGAARNLKRSQFRGVDRCHTSLQIARELAQHYRTQNVGFSYHDLTTPLDRQHDVIVCTGVLTCIPEYQIAIRNLLDAVTGDGYLLLWVYHLYGEFSRLLDQKLALLFAERTGRTSIDEQLDLLRLLNLSLPVDQYGTITAAQRRGSDHRSIDADAYLQPVVNLFSFQAMADALRDGGADWVALNGVNWRGSSRLVDCGNTMEDPYFSVTADDFAIDQSLRHAYGSFSLADKLRVIELALKPTGFTVLAGKGRSFALLGERVRGNVMRLEGSGRTQPAGTT